MPIYQYCCRECKTEFEKYKHMGNTKVITDHGVDKSTYWIDDKKVSKEEFEKMEDTTSDIDCPACLSKDIKRVFYPIAVVWDDNITPGSGFSTVDKRHQEGIDWDNPVGKMQAAEANRQMKEAGRKEAIKMAKKDEEKIRKEYRKVSEREALDIMKDPNRKQEIAVIDESASNT